MILHDRIDNPLTGLYYPEYPALDNPQPRVMIRYADVGDTTTEQVHLRQVLDATRTTRVITSDTQVEFKPRSYVLLTDGLFQISTVTKSVINPRSLIKRYRYGMSLVGVENPLGLKT